MLKLLICNKDKILVDKEIATLIATYCDPETGVYKVTAFQAQDPSNTAPADINMSTVVAMLDNLLDILKQNPDICSLAQEKLVLFSEAVQELYDSSASSKQEES